jgi:two-component system sporulation sensor kinase A
LSVSEYALSEKTLLSILNAITDGILIVKLDGTIVEANNAVLHLHGVTRDECIGRQIDYFIDPQDRQRFREDLQLVLRKGNIRSEIKALRRDRTTFPAEINSSLLRDNSGKPDAIVEIVRDRTHPLRVQEQINKTTRELTALMKSSTEIIRTKDLHQRLKAIAQAIQGQGWRRVLITLTDENLETTDIVSVGLTPEEEKYLWENRQPGHVWRQRLGSMFERFKIGEFYYLPWSDPFVRNHFKTGTVDSKIPKEEMVDWDPQDLLYAPLRLPGGRIEGRISIDDPLDGRRPTKESLASLELFVHQAAVAIENAYLIRDLETARNQVKEYADQLELKVDERTRELNELEKKYESVVENANDGVTIVQDGLFVFVNKKMAEMSGYSVKDWVGKDMLWLVPNGYREKLTKTLGKLTPDDSILKHIFPQTYTLRISTRDRKELLLETSSTVIDFKGKPAILTVARDITERERMQEQLKNAQRLAVIGELAASVGHDLRNPLTGIKGAAYYLKMKLSSKMDKKSKEMLDIIDSDIQYSNKIINDLLDFSRDIRLVRNKTNVKAIIEETLARMQIPRKVKILDFTKRTPQISVDAGQMNRVFENIIKNAVEAMPKGGQLEIKSEQVNTSLKVTFRDKGVGISKENLSKLGSPLFTTKAKGVGMGLAICKRLIEAHEGSISIESEEKKGTCVTIILPIDAEKKEHEQKGVGR